MKRLYGFGTDSDGHTRITRANNFELHGGSKDTHQMMQEIAIRLDEKIKKDGKNFQEINSREMKDRLIEAYRKTGI